MFREGQIEDLMLKKGSNSVMHCTKLCKLSEDAMGNDKEVHQKFIQGFPEATNRLYNPAFNPPDKKRTMTHFVCQQYCKSKLGHSTGKVPVAEVFEGKCPNYNMLVKTGQLQVTESESSQEV